MFLAEIDPALSAAVGDVSAFFTSIAAVAVVMLLFGIGVRVARRYLK